MTDEQFNQLMAVLTRIMEAMERAEERERQAKTAINYTLERGVPDHYKIIEAITPSKREIG